MKVIHNAEVIVGDYQFADSLKKEVLSLLKTAQTIGHTNVKASLHTAFDWEPDNLQFRNLRAYIREQIEKVFKPGATADGCRAHLNSVDFWGNVYEKGDYAKSHCHKPHDYSFAYFVQSKWYYSPLVFTYSGKKIRPKEGRYVIFPSFLKHHVPEHRYKGKRITLSGNYRVDDSNFLK
tara:strand:+ start:189 stop:722 length:534 start_codon:yes stop_codon:yes gene_type:complete